MKTVTIRQSWFSLHPHGRMDALYWIAVVEELRAKGIEPLKATDDEVRAAMARVKE